MKGRLKDYLGHIGEHSFRFGSGLAVGSFDSWSTGLPLATSWFLLKYLEASTYYHEYKSGIKFTHFPAWLCMGEYVLGNLIPFAIKYQDEISNFVEEVLK